MVIVGSGVAGITAAKFLRESASDVEVKVYTDESHLYYPRPRLYEVLSGEKEPEGIYPFARSWYERNSIDVHLGKKALSIDIDGKKLALDDGSRISYDSLLLANGAHPFVPSVKGAEKMGVFTLRTIEDALTIKRYAKNMEKAIVIGGGLLGIEFAACLRKLGQQVQVIGGQPRLLPMQLDQQGSSMLRDHLETLGIESKLGVKIDEILGKDAVSGVSFDNGEEVSGGLVLVATGVEPNAQLAAASGIKVNKGIVVDQYLQTSASSVFAAGDVCEFQGQVYGIIPPAVDQARVASMNVLKKESYIYRGSTRFTTLKVSDISITSIGLANLEKSGYEEIRRIDERECVYKKIVLDHGRIVGAILMGDRRDASTLMKLVDGKADVTNYKERLLEDDFDYNQVLQKQSLNA